MNTKLSDNTLLTLSIIEYKSMLIHALENGLWNCLACEDSGEVLHNGQWVFCQCDVGQADMNSAMIAEQRRGQ